MWKHVFFLWTVIFLSLLLFKDSHAFSLADSTSVEPLRFGDNYIEEYLSDPDYHYGEFAAEENWIQKLKRKLNEAIRKFLSWLFGDAKFGKTADFILQALPYFAIIVLSGLLIWLVSKYELYSTSDKKFSKRQVSLSDDEAIMQRQDIQQLIDKAVANGDFRLAVRFSYLVILKQMKEKSLIDWKIQKTNHDYLIELPEGSLKLAFAQVTRVYDYIWYGRFEVDKAGYESVKKSFNQLEQHL